MGVRNFTGKPENGGGAALEGLWLVTQFTPPAGADIAAAGVQCCLNANVVDIDTNDSWREVTGLRVATLSGNAAEAEPHAALREIATALSLRPEEVTAEDEHALRQRIAARVRADFEEGDTVDIAGWMLARTEVRLCLLWL